MAKVNMIKLELIAPLSEQDEIMQRLIKYSKFEVREYTERPEREEISQKRAEVLKNQQLYKKAIDVLDKYCPEKRGLREKLEGRRPIFANELDDAKYLTENMINLAGDILNKAKHHEKAAEDIVKVKDMLASLKPYLGLGCSIPPAGTKRVGYFIGSVPGKMTEARVRELILSKAAKDIELCCQLISQDRRITRVVVCYLKKDEDAALGAITAAGVSAPGFSCDMPPAQFEKELLKKLERLEFIKQETYLGMDALASSKYLLLLSYDYNLSYLEILKAQSRMYTGKRYFYACGYVPITARITLRRALGYHTASLIFSTPEPGDDVPVALRNNRFAGAVEGVVTSYSMPGPGEADPSPFVAAFYYLLFGLMLSDAAYGLIITFGCLFMLRRFEDMRPSLKSAVRMFMYCGISTTFWGIIFGSFFGDVVGRVASDFFGVEFTLKPLWFAPIDDPMKMLLFSLGLGLLHILFALSLKIYSCLKNRDVLGAVGDGVCWMALVLSLVILLATSSIFESISGFRLKLYTPVFIAVIAVAAVSAVGIILLSGRDSKNPFKRILKGIYGLYGISGYLSDLLSYSRLLALGLATGVIATVVNQMATMLGRSVIGVIAFILIFTIGHAINFAINILGAYVHTNRLEYIEFFGKFYKGGGRPFEPLQYNTKYYQIIEEEHLNG